MNEAAMTICVQVLCEHIFLVLRKYKGGALLVIG